MNNNQSAKLIGDGGLATDRFIKEEIIKRFGNPILNELEDSGLVSLQGSKALISTDSFVVSPLFFPNSDIGSLAIAGTINDILSSGGNPTYMTLGLILSEDLELNSLRKILDSIQKMAEDNSIRIIAGDTKSIFLGRNSEPNLFINTTGIGIPILNPHQTYSVANAKPGDNIIVTGEIGNHGISVLSIREGLGFESKVISDCQSLKDLIVPLVEKFHSGIQAMRDPSRGGLTGVIVDIANSSNVDIRIDYSQIPIKREVYFGSEMLGLDPLDLVNEGKMVLVVKPDYASDILDYLRNHPKGQDSAIIGEVRKSESLSKKVILYKDGRRTVLSKNEGIGVPRLC